MTDERDGGAATLPTLIAELEEAERRAKTAWDVYNTSLRQDDLHTALIACRDRDTLNRTHLPVLLEAVKRQGEALEKIDTKCPPKDKDPDEDEYDFNDSYFNTPEDYARYREARARSASIVT